MMVTLLRNKDNDEDNEDDQIYLGVIVQIFPPSASKVIIALAEAKPELTIAIILMIIIAIILIISTFADHNYPSLPKKKADRF